MFGQIIMLHMSKSVFACLPFIFFFIHTFASLYLSSLSAPWYETSNFKEKGVVQIVCYPPRTLLWRRCQTAIACSDCLLASQHPTAVQRFTSDWPPTRQARSIRHENTPFEQGLHSIYPWPVEAECFSEKVKARVKLAKNFFHLTNQQNAVVCIVHKRLKILA